MKPEVDFDRLCQAAYRCNISLARCRENVNFMVRQYVGDNYAEDGAELRVPLNLVSLYHKIVLPKLVSDDPRIALSTWTDAVRQTVETMQDVANDASKRMRLGATLERVASAALFNSGWCKVGLAKGQDVGRFAWKLQKGHVYAQNIALDDICFDIHARTVDESYFIGHRYRVPLQDVKDDPRFKGRAKDLKPTEDKMYTELGVERTSMILRGYYGQDNDLFDMVELWEFFIPRYNLIVVATSEDVFGSAGGAPLLEEEWIGPPGGSPYHLLGFGPVPENLLPKAPIPDIMTLHEDTNNLLRKLIMQGKDQKQVLPVPAGSEGDAKRLQVTSNGEMFECSRPDALKLLDLGGPSAANFQLMNTLKEFLDWSAGNISAVGGLAPQAKTLGQERLISESSNATVADMQRRMTDYAAGVCEHILWYLWEDPFTSYDQPLLVPGLDLAIPRQVTAKDRKKVPFEKLRLTIEPYSLQRQTPVERDAKLTQLVMQEIAPILQLLIAQGTNINMQEYLQIKAKNLNMPELLRIMQIQEPPQDQTQPTAEGPGKPAATQREYVRHNTSERTNQGAANERVDGMFAAAQNQGE